MQDTTSTATRYPVPPAIGPLQRRCAPRFPLMLRARAELEDHSLAACAAVDVSEGGLCLTTQGARAPEQGERVTVSVDLPGGAPLVLSGTVKWRRHAHGEARFGVEFGAKLSRAVVGVLVAASISVVPTVAEAGAKIPTFDPQADINLDDYDGSERPDETIVMEAFEARYDAIDACVNKARGKKEKLDGYAEIAVLLNPNGALPKGVNASIPASLKGKKALAVCLRTAVASADFPTYNGPPVVVEFEFEIDPGYDIVDEES